MAKQGATKRHTAAVEAALAALPADKPKRVRKEKPPMRKRVSEVNLDTRLLQGPYWVSGDLIKKTPPRGGGEPTGRIRERVWFDPQSQQFVFADGRLAFDAMPSHSPPEVESARSKEREKLTARLAEEQRLLNDAKRAMERARTDEQRRKAQGEVRKLTKLRDEVAKQVEALKTSTQKIEDRGMVIETRKLGSAGVKQGRLPVLAEYDRTNNQVRLFFAGARAGEEAKPGVAPSQQSRIVVPALKNMLEQYVDPEAKNSGERGYWAVSAWDYPKVVQQLAQLPEVRLLGAPELDLSKKFKSLDARAKAVETRKIEFGEATPRAGETQDGKQVDFQTDGIKFLMSRDHAILADDMGLGKTYQAIVAAQNAVPKDKQILVLCPPAMIPSWLGDIARFMPSASAIGFDTAYVDKEGEPSARPEKVRFFICSYQGASSQQGKAAVSNLLLQKKWGLVILDEAHRLKHHDTLLHKYVEALQTDRMWFLTGTPISNRVTDYYGLLKLAQHPAGRRLDAFKEQYVPTVVKAGKTEVAMDREPLLALGEGLTGFVLRRTKEEVLSKFLPKKIGGIATNDGFLEAQLPRAFAQQMLIDAKRKVARERLRHGLAVAKTPATWEIAQRVIDAGDKIVLFSTYTDVLHSFAELCEDAKVLYIVISGETSTLGKGAVVKLFQGETIEAKEEKWVVRNLGQWWLNLVRYVPEADWKEADLEVCRKKFGRNPAKWPHEIQAVLAQMVAASEGVTLTQADTMLFNDFDYMPSRHQQAEDRIYRLSRSTKLPHPAVYIGYVYANDPLELDRSVLTGLRAKMAEINDVYGATGNDLDAAAKRVRDQYLQELQTAGEARTAASMRGTQFSYGAALRGRGKKRNPWSSSTMGA